MPRDHIEATRSGSLASRDKDRMARAGKNTIMLCCSDYGPQRDLAAVLRAGATIARLPQRFGWKFRVATLLESSALLPGHQYSFRPGLTPCRVKPPQSSLELKGVRTWHFASFALIALMPYSPSENAANLTGRP